MVVIDLAPGDHTVKWTLSGYSQLVAVINVGSTGIVTCKSVTGGSCGSSTSPGVVVSGSTVTGYLKSGEISNICSWITGLGGRTAITAYNIMSLVSAYSGATNVGFTVTASHIMGVVAYYSGNVSSGNSLTGCAFT
ncbi:MAG: hypothetical protein ABH833_00275 [Parcubacteria group bacterium]